MASRIYWLISHSRKECTFAFGEDGSEYHPPKGWELADLESLLNGQMETWSQLDKKRQLLNLCPKGYKAVFPDAIPVISHRFQKPAKEDLSDPRILIKKTSPFMRQAMKFTVAIILAGWLITTLRICASPSRSQMVSHFRSRKLGKLCV